MFVSISLTLGSCRPAIESTIVTRFEWTFLSNRSHFLLLVKRRLKYNILLGFCSPKFLKTPNFLLSIHWVEQIHEGFLIPKGLKLNFSFRSLKHFQLSQAYRGTA